MPERKAPKAARPEKPVRPEKTAPRQPEAPRSVREPKPIREPKPLKNAERQAEFRATRLERPNVQPVRPKAEPLFLETPFLEDRPVRKEEEKPAMTYQQYMQKQRASSRMRFSTGEDRR